MAFELHVEKRQVFGKKVKHLRQRGIVPCEIYGRSIDNQSIQAPEKTLRKVLNEAGRTNFINLKIDGGEEIMALVKQVQRSPIRSDLMHVDFQAAGENDKISVSVPIRFVGESPLVSLGGLLIQGLSTLDIETTPKDLPSAIEVDISRLAQASDVITVSDLDLPDTLTIQSNPDSMIATVQAARLATDDALDAAVGEATESVIEEGEAADS